VGHKVSITEAEGLEGVQQELSVKRNKDLGGVIMQAARGHVLYPMHEMSDMHYDKELVSI
jgi:hypothetical protein